MDEKLSKHLAAMSAFGGYILERKPDSWSSNIADDFFFIGRDELESAKILFSKNQVPQAIFLLQQSAEKLSKYCLVKSGMAKLNELNTHSAYKKRISWASEILKPSFDYIKYKSGQDFSIDKETFDLSAIFDELESLRKQNPRYLRSEAIGLVPTHLADYGKVKRYQKMNAFNAVASRAVLLKKQLNIVYWWMILIIINEILIPFYERTRYPIDQHQKKFESPRYDKLNTSKVGVQKEIITTKLEKCFDMFEHIYY